MTDTYQTITIDAGMNTVNRRTENATGSVLTEERDPVQFAVGMGDRSVLSTGLLPPGVISIRRGGGYEQIVLQVQPGVYNVIWGEAEGAEAPTYRLAQPYRVIIGEFHEGAFLGARMFYSPTPINTLDDPLYHANVPNLNCQGYKSTGVGWVCLYHKEDTAEFTLAEKAAYLGLKCSGNEAFNDANMRKTDGTRFYQTRFPDLPWLWNPTEWEKMSEAEGYEWTLNPDLWIPVTVASIDDQYCHDEDIAQPLTLGMAMTGNTAYYYRDVDFPRLYNAIDRGLPIDLEQIYSGIFQKAYNRAARLSIHEIAPEMEVPEEEAGVIKDAVLPHGKSATWAPPEPQPGHAILHDHTHPPGNFILPPLEQENPGAFDFLGGDEEQDGLGATAGAMLVTITHSEQANQNVFTAIINDEHIKQAMKATEEDTWPVLQMSNGEYLDSISGGIVGFSATSRLLPGPNSTKLAAVTTVYDNAGNIIVKYPVKRGLDWAQNTDSIKAIAECAIAAKKLRKYYKDTTLFAQSTDPQDGIWGPPAYFNNGVINPFAGFGNWPSVTIEDLVEGPVFEEYKVTIDSDKKLTEDEPF